MPYIYVFETFVVTLPASSEGPANAIQGYIVDGVPFAGEPKARGYTFRELVELLRGKTVETFAGMTWVANMRFRTDALTGAVESRGFHPKDARDARYFWKAYRLANIKQPH